MRKLRTLLQSRYLFKILAFIVLLFSLFIISFLPFHSKYKGDEDSFRGIIKNIKVDGDAFTITFFEKENIIGYYYFQSEKEKNIYSNSFHLGDKIFLSGTLHKAASNTYFNGFDYQKYLYYHKIYYILDIQSIKKIENNVNVFYYFKNRLIDRLDRIDDTGYLHTFLIGNQFYLDSDVSKIYQENGISHLFSVSGMHVTFIVSFFYFFFKKFSYRVHYFSIIMIPLLFFYAFLCDYSVSILRTVLLFMLAAINDLFHLKIKRIDLMLLVFIVTCLINPFYLFDIGFQFSYSISISLILFSKKFKNVFLNQLYSSFLCFLISMPISIFYFYQINFFSILLNLLFIPFVSFVIFPFSFIVFAFPFMGFIYHFFVYILEGFNDLFHSISFFTITFSKPSFYFIILLYIFIFLGLKKKIFLVCVIFLLFGYKIGNYVSSSYLVSFMDVGQGDAILLSFPHHRNHILIDTGGKVSFKEEWQKKKRDFLYTDSRIIPYFKSLDIHQLDYLIITHGDYDHMGEAINLVNNYKVEKVIFNCGPYNNLEKELIKVLDKKKIKYYSCIKELNIDKNKLYFLQTKEYDNENDNSNVIYADLNGYKFMLMGDASTTTENEILDKYNLPDIDVLKVGHHGSKTSSSKEFIDEINPKYSIISVGKKNRYGHPNEEILDILKNSKIYRTDHDGSIMFKIKNNKLKIEACSP